MWVFSPSFKTHSYSSFFRINHSSHSLLRICFIYRRTHNRMKKSLKAFQGYLRPQKKMGRKLCSSKARHSRCDWVPNLTCQQKDMETPSQAKTIFLIYWCLMNIYLSLKQKYVIYILLLWRHVANFSPLDFVGFFLGTQLKSNSTHKSQPISDMQLQYGNTWATFPMPLQLQQN